MTLNELVDKMTFNDKLINMCDEGDENWKELMAKQQELAEKLQEVDLKTFNKHRAEAYERWQEKDDDDE